MASKKQTVAQDLVKYFCEWFEMEYERAYIPNVTRHVPKMQLMVDNFEPHYIKELIKSYFGRQTGFHSLDDFFSNYDQVIAYIEQETKDKEEVNRLLDRTSLRVSEALRKAKEQ